jgi:hypothetical protein
MMLTVCVLFAAVWRGDQQRHLQRGKQRRQYCQVRAASPTFIFALPSVFPVPDAAQVAAAAAAAAPALPN